MKKNWKVRSDFARLAKYTKIFIKYWKESVFIVSFLALIIAIIFAVSVTNTQLKEAEKNAKVSLVKYNLVNSWKGTNGEVLKSFTVDISNVYLALGEDGLSILDNHDLVLKASFITNLSFNDIAVKKFGTNILAFLAVGDFETPGGVVVCDITDFTNIRIITSILVSNSISERIKVLTDNGKKIDIFTSDKNNGFVLYNYDEENNTLSAKNLGFVRNYTGIEIDADKKIICSVSKSGYVYLYNWKGELLSTISNSLSMANSVSLYGGFMVIGDRMGGVILYNVADPRNCVLLVNYNTSGDTYDAFEMDNSIFIADGINGILKVRREKFSGFTLEKQFNDGAIYNKLFYSAENGNLYAGCGKDGLRILN